MVSDEEGEDVEVCISCLSFPQEAAIVTNLVSYSLRCRSLPYGSKHKRSHRVQGAFETEVKADVKRRERKLL